LRWSAPGGDDGPEGEDVDDTVAIGSRVSRETAEFPVRSADRVVTVVAAMRLPQQPQESVPLPQASEVQDQLFKEIVRPDGAVVGLVGLPSCFAGVKADTLLCAALGCGMSARWRERERERERGGDLSG
jgi:hypothetical protein